VEMQDLIHVRQASLVRIMLLVRIEMATTDASASLVTKERTADKISMNVSAGLVETEERV